VARRRRARVGWMHRAWWRRRGARCG